jgi:hypothetical protein
MLFNRKQTPSFFNKGLGMTEGIYHYHCSGRLELLVYSNDPMKALGNLGFLFFNKHRWIFSNNNRSGKS